MNKKHNLTIIIVFIFHIAQAQINDNCLSCCKLSDKKIDLKEGCNYSDCPIWMNCEMPCTLPNNNSSFLSKPVYRVFQFDAKFKENCKYNLKGTHWQKLMKISTLPNSDDRSIRLGWRSNNTDQIEIGLYGHVYSEMVFLTMDYFSPLETKVADYELILSYNGLFTKVPNRGYGIKRNIFDKDLWYSTGMTKNAFFEGPDEVGAPHDMRIEVSDIYYDCDAEWDNMPNKGFYYSVFYDNESTTVFASNIITAPVEPGKGANTDYKTVIVEKGSNTTFMSGNSIKLSAGFHARNGSHFKAVISSGKNNIDTAKNLFSVVVPDSIIEHKVVSETLKAANFKNDSLEINSWKVNTLLSIYPNPSPGLFTLRFDDGESSGFAVEITNMMGNVVYKKGNAQMGNTAVDIRKQPKGVYFVKVQAGGKVYIEKVVVE